jgi:hypothetical protein
MKKFIVYRLPADKSEPRGNAELVSIEYGENIAEATPTLVKVAAADLSAIPEYNGWQTTAYKPEEMHPGRKYQYIMHGVVYPPNAAENILFDFVIREEIAQPGEYPPTLEPVK